MGSMDWIELTINLDDRTSTTGIKARPVKILACQISGT